MDAFIARSRTNKISQAAVIEAVAAFCAKARQGAITDADRDTLIVQFKQDCSALFALVPVTIDIYNRGGELCTRYKLRAYDAVQITCALTIRDAATTLGAPEPVFVCADTDLLAVAAAEGMFIENPNTHV